MFSLALTVYLLFIAVFATFSAALIYHVQKYAVKEDPSYYFITPYIAISLILISISAYLFSRVPWDSFTL